MRWTPNPSEYRVDLSRSRHRVHKDTRLTILVFLAHVALVLALIILFWN
jgi:hypothetical protein